MSLTIISSQNNINVLPLNEELSSLSQNNDVSVLNNNSVELAPSLELSRLESLEASFKQKVDTIEKNGVVSLDDNSNEDVVSMSDLMALLSQVISSTHEYQNQLMRNRISAAESTVGLAHALADKKKDSAKTKFAINLAANVAHMGATVAFTFKTARVKKVEDKHLVSMTKNEGAKVSDLSASQLNDFGASLQQKSTAKYNMMSQASGLAKETVGSINEIQYAGDVKVQDDMQATKELKERYDEQLNSYIESLNASITDMLQTVKAAQSAALPNNR